MVSALEKSTSPITSALLPPVPCDVSTITKLSEVTERRLTVSGGIGFLRPVPVLAGAMQKARFGEALAEFGNIHAAKFFVRRDRQFERGALQMIHQNFQIVRLDEGVLGRAAEEIIRMLHDELVERRGRSDQHGAGSCRCGVRRGPRAARWRRSCPA